MHLGHLSRYFLKRYEVPMGALSTSRQNISDRNFRFSAKIGFSTKSIPIPSQSYAVCRAERLYEAGSYQFFFKVL